MATEWNWGMAIEEGIQELVLDPNIVLLNNKLQEQYFFSITNAQSLQIALFGPFVNKTDLIYLYQQMTKVEIWYDDHRWPNLLWLYSVKERFLNRELIVCGQSDPESLQQFAQHLEWFLKEIRDQFSYHSPIYDENGEEADLQEVNYVSQLLELIRPELMSDAFDRFTQFQRG